MSSRDDWRSSRDVKDRALEPRVDLQAAADRALDRADEVADVSLSLGGTAVHLAALAGLGFGAYAAVKSRRGKALAQSVKSWLNKQAAAEGGGVLAKARRAIGRIGAQQAPAAVAQQAIQPQILNPNLLHDISVANKVFGPGSEYLAGEEMVLRTLMSRYNYGDVATSIPQQVLELVNQPRFRAATLRMGYGPEAVAEVLAGAAKHTERTVGGVIKDIAHKIRVPFTENWRPVESLIPTELLGSKPSLAFIPKANLANFADVGEDVVEGLYAGGAIFPVSEFRRRGRGVWPSRLREIARKPVGFGQLGDLMSGMGRGAKYRMGEHGTLSVPDILNRYPQLGTELAEGASIFDTFKQPGVKWWDKVQRFALEVGERYGIGPQYSPRGQLGGRFTEAVQRLSARVKVADVEYLQSGPSVGGSPEIRQIFGQLEKVGLMKQTAFLGPKDLRWYERLNIGMGGIPHRNVMATAGGHQYTKETPLVNLLDAAGSKLNVPMNFQSAAALRGYDHYAFKSSAEGLSDWLNHHLMRPTWLMNEMVGLGLKAGRTPAQTLWNIGTRVALPAYLGYQMLQYAEYKSRKYFGYGPISGPAKVFLEGRTQAQSLLDSVGITEKAEELEEQFPGAIESPFSKAAALIGGTFGGGWVGRRLGGGKGAAVGLAAGLTAGLINAMGVTTPATELREIYEGEREVPVRADRWWALGRHPWGGSRIKYWKKHWFAEMMSDYKEIALYGNRKEAWRDSWLPTPENFFLLKNLYDPYYLERSHFYDRPYPVTSPLFTDMPLLGPLAGKTVGSILKPPVYRQGQPLSAWGLTRDTYEGQYQATALGYQPIAASMDTPPNKLALAQMTGETIHRLFDWSGMPGFMLGALKEQITGRPGFFEQEVLLASSDAMASAQRDYYDRNLGGMLGGTEFLRRFIPRRRRNQYVNPLTNLAPEWLPGHRSVFPADRLGYLNFHQGDPYTLLEKGEARLPGPGYEALEELHSGVPGVYDDFDRFKILSDVAPFSESYKFYRRRIQQKVESGQLSLHDARRYQQINDNLAERIESKVSAGGARFRTGAFATDKVTISRALSPSTFQVAEMPGTTFRLAGVKQDAAGLDSTQMQSWQRLKAKMRALEGQQVSLTWGGIGVETPAIVDKVNQEAIQSGLEEARLTGLGFRAKHGYGGVKAAWEALSQFQMPAFLDYGRVKWLGTRTPTQEYEQFQAYGTADTDWAHPIRNYILPWWHSTIREPTAQATRARKITNYMDHLQYMKYRRLELQANQARNGRLSQQYADRSRQTLVGLRTESPNFWQDIYRALPAAERPYFNVFAGVTGESEQERIIRAVPDYMKPVYMGLWKKKMSRDNFDSPILRRYAQQAQDLMSEPADARVAEFFSQNVLPKGDWAGWHPGVDLRATTIKTAEREGIGIHQLGMWESQAIQMQTRFPFMDPVQFDTGGGWEIRDAVADRLNRLGYTGINSMSGSVFGTDKLTLNIKKRKRAKGGREASFSGAHSWGGY